MLIELLTKRYPGMRLWLMQRFSAIFMTVFFMLFAVRYWLNLPQNFSQWQQFNQPLWWRVASWLFWVALLLHAWLGVCDVLKDYIPKYWLRALLTKLLYGLLWLYFFWVSYLWLSL
jgi:succinate dehydrogenase / fumarate reductase membrane anchor subunit